MNEPHVAEDLLAYVSGNLDEAAVRVVEGHLASCGECRRDYETVQAVWRDLGRAHEERPAPSLARGFHAMLSAYEQGMRQPEERPARMRGERLPERSRFRTRALQSALAVCILIIGLVGGYNLKGSGEGNTPDIAQLREEVRDLRNLLTVSLLQQESASERLKGVSWSARLEGHDPQINTALVNTMRYDPNVNVRLAALEALARDAGNPDVQREIILALPHEGSPLMQIALVDLLIEMHGKEARDVLQQVMNKTNLHPEVRKRIVQGMQMIL